jgi:hypothetical protein
LYYFFEKKSSGDVGFILELATFARPVRSIKMACLAKGCPEL